MGIESYLSTLEVAPVMGEALTQDNTLELSLDAFKTELLHLKDRNKTSLLQVYLDEKRKVEGKKYAIGGYLEDRSWYARSPLFGKSRSIHLAIDVWAEAGHPVYAPLAGTVHSFADNKGFGNYGPTIIIEHNLNAKVAYTLYGHLSKESMQNWEVGSKIKAGDLIGKLGEIVENGEWPAHLHFQIIKDLQGNKGDYPGVCSAEDVKYYQKNCPDPNILLRYKI